MNLRLLSVAVMAALFSHGVLAASEVEQLRAEIQALRRAYESRLRVLEDKVNQAAQAASAPSSVTATTAATASAELAPPPPAINSARPAPTATSSANSFNPAISLILGGSYAHLSRDPEAGGLHGFALSSELEPLGRGLNLGESELGLSANVDNLFWGNLTLAFGDGGAGVEEAFIQSTALPSGLTLKLGRFFSSLGYLNERHAHTWDFVDNPLAYQVFLGNQYAQDGLQLKWLAPTDQFIELNAEVGRGAGFPGSDVNRNSVGSATLGLRMGGDVGVSHSWRAGAAYLINRPRERAGLMRDQDGNALETRFSGRSTLWVLDGVWKWSPNGNAKQRYWQIQGEYLRRLEDGTLSAATTDRHHSAQSGWYAQGVYQFQPKWRAGLRFDQLNPGQVDFASNTASLLDGGSSSWKPQRLSTMLDWSPSEFSRIRLQLAQDRSRAGERDNQLLLQYQMSLGAHGAHSY
jgi:hypothetical protein